MGTGIPTLIGSITYYFSTNLENKNPVPTINNNTGLSNFKSLNYAQYIFVYYDTWEPFIFSYLTLTHFSFYCAAPESLFAGHVSDVNSKNKDLYKCYYLLTIRHLNSD